MKPQKEKLQRRGQGAGGEVRADNDRLLVISGIVKIQCNSVKH